MHIELLLKLFSLQEPWSIGCRQTIKENEETLKTAPVEELPYYASRGLPDSQFKVIGGTLEEVIEHIVLDPPVMAGPVAEASVHFVTPPETKS